MPNAPLAFSFTLPFSDAIAAAKSRGVMLPDEYYGQIPLEKRRETFSVSNLTRLDQVQGVLDKLTDHLQQGGTLRQFQDWAKTQDFNLSPHRLETIYRNGVQTAYNAGQWRAFEQHKKRRPYLMYDAINDSRTRPAHQALDNIIRPVDDPFWASHSPPLGHRCRCSLLSLSETQAQARSRDGKGLSKPETPEMQADNEGWGRKPTQWDDTLNRIEKTKLDKLPPPIRDATRLTDRAKPKITDTSAWLPDCDGKTIDFAPNSPCIAPVPGQPTWKDAGRLDLRRVDDAMRLPVPAMLTAASTRIGAIDVLAGALGLSAKSPMLSVVTPREIAIIRYDSLYHLVEKETDARERYANFILPTLTDPFEIWGVDYSDGVRNRYIGLFKGTRDFMTVLRVNLDGSLMWNVMQATPDKMNGHRIGKLIYGK